MFCQKCGREIEGNERYCEPCKEELFGQQVQSVQQQTVQEMAVTEQYVNIEQQVPVDVKSGKGTSKVKSGIILVSAVAVAAVAGWGIGKMTTKPEYIQVAVEGETVKIDSEDYQKVCDEKESLVLQVEEISKSQEILEGKVDSLTDKNAQLAVEKIEVLQENESLVAEVDSMTASMPKLQYSDIDVSKDGIVVSNIKSGFVIIDGKQYVTYDLLSQITDETLSLNDNVLYVGNITGEKVYLMEVCPPYDSKADYGVDLFEMNGETYDNGILFKGSSNYVVINLDGKYANLEFDFGHIDGKSKLGGIINIYLDDKLVKTFEKEPDQVVTHEIVSLNHAKHLKIEFESSSEGHYTEYGLGEIKLTY